MEDSEGNQVWIAALLAADIQKANKTGKHPFHQKRHYLHTVASPTYRQAVYERTARAWKDLEESLLPAYGGRKWKVKVTIKDPVNKKGHAVSPFFCFMDGNLELAVWPHWLLSIPMPPRFPGHTKKRNKAAAAAAAAAAAHAEDGDDESDSQVVVEEEDEEEVDEDLEALQTREASPLSALAMAERWRVPTPSYSIRWMSPLRESFSTRKSAWEHAKTLCQQEVFLDKILLGYNGNGQPITKITSPSAKTALKAGQLRFLRDGLWVIGQEEAWHQERLEEVEPPESPTPAVVTPPSTTRRMTALALYLQEKRKLHQARRLKELVDSSGSDEKISFSLRQAETELRVVWKNLRQEDRNLWAERADRYQREIDNKATAEVNSDDCSDADSKEAGESLPPVPCATNATSTVVDSNPQISSVSSNDEASERSGSPDSEPQISVIQSGDSDAAGYAGEDASSDSPLYKAGRVTPSSESELSPEHKSEQMSNGHSTVTPSPFENQKTLGKRKSSPSAKENGLALVTGAAKKSATTLTTAKKPTPAKPWCLTPEQTKLCYDAGLEHYDNVISTVKARDLLREFEDGFDVLRERGRGRFDMELPVFGQPEFNFLTDPKKTPWMPVVRQILGKDVVLIHKGMFLSLPGSETQKYHQDGPHLTTQYQKPCHAINVFIPLIDLKLESGPTEFCLGTHILGQEDYDEAFLETPLVDAGTPVIFDYRLGHKGLANTSDTCRPVVYCTYAAAADGKEFRDSVNFSRKRYHKIGTMVSKSLTREERAQKRQRVLDDEQLDKAVELSLSMANEGS